jgi:hypothetical protein
MTLAGLVLLSGCTQDSAVEAATGRAIITDTRKEHMQNSPIAEINQLDRSIAQAEYDLSGGTKVVIHKPYGSGVYSAVFSMKDGHYPQLGSVATNRGRHEMLYVIEGKFVLTLNAKDHLIDAGQNRMICDGDSYSLRGSGTCLVVVRDEPGGATIVEPTSLTPK